MKPRPSIGVSGAPRDFTEIPEQLFDEPLTDEQIEGLYPQLLERLDVDARGVRLGFEPDTLHLRGSVATKAARRVAGDLAARLAGSRAVSNEVEVRSH